MDEIVLKRQIKSMGSSLKIQTLDSAQRRFARQRIVHLLSVEPGPWGAVFTFVCRPSPQDQQGVQAVEVPPRGRHQLLAVVWHLGLAGWYEALMRPKRWSKEAASLG